jgi:ATP-dependent DNA helicase RecQ
MPATSNLKSVFKQLADQLSSKLGSAPILPPVPMLLVDDMVDSGWTLTLAAVLLRQHGSGPVYPFALAKASPRGG